MLVQMGQHQEGFCQDVREYRSKAGGDFTTSVLGAKWLGSKRYLSTCPTRIVRRTSG